VGLQRLAAAALGVTLVLGAGAAGASKEAKPAARAQAVAIEVTLPGQTPIVFGGVATPPDAAVTNGTIIYPADGSVVNATSVSESVSAAPAAPAATAAVDVGPLSLFGGEITAGALAARAAARGAGGVASGDFAGSALTNLVVLGQPVQPVPNLRLQLGDWGHAVVLGQEVRSAVAASYRGTLIALDVTLDADHGGLPAGSRVEVGLVEAAAAVPAPPPPASTAAEPAPATTAAAPRPVERRAKATAKPKPEKRPARKRERRAPEERTGPAGMLPPNVHPNLGPGLYVFPVFGAASYGDTYGAARSDVEFHHGGDIFAPLGTPVLAVADGTIFSVGWEQLGGNRLWLRDRHGNQFYYSHLAAYSTLAVNGAEVHAGDVIGFVGNTGDAEGTEYHLHFEVHPVPFLFLGYDGAVNPTKYLDRWRRLEQVRLRPAVGGGPPLARKSGPPPGAVLLRSVDISTADGLEPGSLERVLAEG
jgi:murein DD-endopeptidase MepM/ murein hydrolase activator NlpD